MIKLLSSVIIEFCNRVRSEDEDVIDVTFIVGWLKGAEERMVCSSLFIKC